MLFFTCSAVIVAASFGAQAREGTTTTVAAEQELDLDVAAVRASRSSGARGPLAPRASAFPLLACGTATQRTMLVRGRQLSHRVLATEGV